MEKGRERFFFLGLVQHCPHEPGSAGAHALEISMIIVKASFQCLDAAIWYNSWIHIDVHML
jgi:hypothetical protein